uniref:Alpha_adaptinC2 domain-containing protein n=1 Tax=Heterorhabditis bacteriophora TaxID=37862 RepID=A0A1I7WXY9_HETBA
MRICYQSTAGDEPEITNKNDYLKFVVKNNGVLYEDDIIQIGCKLEARANLARLGMFYGNKTPNQLSDFTPAVHCPGALAQAKPIDPIVQQLINFVCVQEFGKIPIINIQFNYTPFICLCLSISSLSLLKWLQINSSPGGLLHLTALKLVNIYIYVHWNCRLIYVQLIIKSSN